MVDDLLSTIIRYATQTALQSYTQEFEKKAQEERKLYTNVVEKLVKDIIKDEVKSLLPHILPKEVPDFATPVIQSTITKSLENVLDKDLFDSYGKAYHLKRCHEDKDNDEDPPAGPDQGLKKRKTTEEPVFEIADTETPQDQGEEMGNIEDQRNVEEVSNHDWFKKPERPPTPDLDWNAGK
ncbi:hypothetical protein Tco_0076447 [Tanacetum coccineum]